MFCDSTERHSFFKNFSSLFFFFLINLSDTYLSGCLPVIRAHTHTQAETHTQKLNFHFGDNIFSSSHVLICFVPDNLIAVEAKERKGEKKNNRKNKVKCYFAEQNKEIAIINSVASH